MNDLSHTRRTFACCCCPEEGGTSLGAKETAINFRLRLRPLYTVKEALNVLTNEKRGEVLSKISMFRPHPMRDLKLLTEAWLYYFNTITCIT
jgi:hypothetical protein